MEEKIDNLENKEEKYTNSYLNTAWEWIKSILIAVALVVIIRSFLFTPTVVSGQSMEPSFFNTDKLIVNKILYSIREPERGEVIIFEANQEQDFIKRVIALPGETVEVKGDQVFVNGELLDEPYIQDEIDAAKKNGGTYNNLDFPEAIVPEGRLFVMGDNRPNSQDSRRIGFITYDQVIGRADLVFWPIQDIGLVSHEVGENK
ncbi:signal peptidase I [Chengkuizengella sp. 2205SS18-9]|uniref:Signal peptidase I n=2 Tax=Chengkuizengella axinellae TaxID=3064388 RepID=A0ABT9IVX6_9BACL|nr:signal peptidase I [Chengkuizengella sp. 2205SS18-9]MDP5273418.1 signal peptidase I [Chengkuizengella sp. 2205SS18-9]